MEMPLWRTNFSYEERIRKMEMPLWRVLQLVFHHKGTDRFLALFSRNKTMSRSKVCTSFYVKASVGDGIIINQQLKSALDLAKILSEKHGWSPSFIEIR